MKTPEEWVDAGIPWPPARDTMIRWAAMIQEDAVACYQTTEAIEEVEQAIASLEKVLKAGDFAEIDAATSMLKAAIAQLGPLKRPMGATGE